MTGTSQGSETPQGEGWWQASDGRYYPPELHPEAMSGTDGAGEPDPVGGGAGAADPTSGSGAAPAPTSDPAAGGSTAPQTVAVSGQPSPTGPPSDDPTSAAPSSGVTNATADPTVPQASSAPGAPPPGGPPPGGPPPGGQPPGGPPPGGQPPGGPPPGGQPPGGPPPGGPPPGGPPPGGPPPDEGKKGGAGRAILIVGLVLLLTAGAFGAWTIFGGDEAAADVVLEPIGESGDDAFTEPVAEEPAGSLLDYASGSSVHDDEATTQLAGYTAADGSVPGVYGGSLDEASCDPELLVEFLGAEPERADAWAAALEIAPDDIPAYVDGLTPVYLSSDTRVVSHGFDDGEAVPRESVLQRGSAVMVDERGVPRVNCYSGSPLREAQPTEDESVGGSEWDGFDRDQVVVIGEAPEPVAEFQLEDIETGELFNRPAGSLGDLDRSAGTTDLVDGEEIELNTEYEDVLADERPEARYLVDVPDGAIVTLRVENDRESDSNVTAELVSEGDRIMRMNRINPGGSEEETYILGHDGGREFELMFSGGPAAYDFEVEVEVQQDAGQEGSAGDDASTAFGIEAGQRVEGLVGDEDEGDVFLLDIEPGSVLQFDAEVAGDADGSISFEVVYENDRIFRDLRLSDGDTTAYSHLFSGEDDGELRVEVTGGTGDYAFLVDFEEQSDAGEAGDAGDERADAREVATGEELTGDVGDHDEEDWYQFEAPSEDVEIAVTSEDGSDGSVSFEVYDSSGERAGRLLRLSSGVTDSFSFEAEEGDEMHLAVSGGRATYTFEIREATDDD